MLPRTGSSLGLIAALALVACQSGARRDRAGDDAGAAEPDRPRTRIVGVAGAPVAPAAVAMPNETQARLIAPGAEPRAPLRYRHDVSGERTLVASFDVTSRSLTDGRWSERARLAPIRQGLAIAAEPGPPPRLRLRPLPATIGDAASADGLRLARMQTERWRALLERRRATATVDDRGRIRAIELADAPGVPGGPSTTPEPAKDELWQYLLGLAVPLPGEPVGVGAEWRVVTMLRIGTATVQQTGEYRLVARDGDRWTIAVTVRRIGERQQVAPEGLPPGSRAELVGLLREVTGTVVVTAADPLPVDGTLSTELRIHVRLHLPDRPMIESASEDLGTVTLRAE